MPFSTFVPAFVQPILRPLQPYGGELLLTISVLALVMFSMHIVRTFSRSRYDVERAREINVKARNTSLVLLGIVMLLIWGSDLKSAILSMAALAAAFVIAWRDLIVCSLGSLYLKVTGSYRIGDRIEILGSQGFIGTVVDISPLHTEIIETDVGGLSTTRSLCFPHSLLLTASLRNHARARAFTVQFLRVSISLKALDVETAEEALRTAAEEACKEFIDAAQAELEKARERELIDFPSHRLRVLLVPEKPGQVGLVLRYPCRAGQQALVEHAILQGFYKAVKTTGSDREAEE